MADGLRRRGVDVTTPQDAGLLAASDTAQLAYCTLHRRVLVTHDTDFLVLHHAGVRHAGIACCGLRARSVGEMVRAVLRLYEVSDASEMLGRVEFL